MSTVADLISSIKIKIDQEGTSGFFSDSDLTALLNEGYRDLVRFTGVWEKDSDITATALIPSITLPPEFLSSRQMRWSYNQQIYPRTERELDYDYKGWMFQYGTPSDAVYVNWNEIWLHPTPSAAGTVKLRHTYFPTTDLTSSDTPSLPKMFIGLLEDYVCAFAFLIMKEYENSDEYFVKYFQGRQELKSRAQVGGMTPDTFDTQRPVDAFNYPLYDPNYRIRGGSV